MSALTNDQLRAMEGRIKKLTTRAVRIMSMGDPHKPDPMEATLALIAAAKIMVLPVVSGDLLSAAAAVSKAAAMLPDEAERYALRNAPIDRLGGTPTSPA